MSLFSNPQEHAENPPETWVVVRVGRRYALQTANGITLDSYERKRNAESARTSGWVAKLYADEARWYAGESVRGWKPYAELVINVTTDAAERKVAALRATFVPPPSN